MPCLLMFVEVGEMVTRLEPGGELWEMETTQTTGGGQAAFLFPSGSWERWVAEVVFGLSDDNLWEPGRQHKAPIKTKKN
jgi:hypothetical protein